MKTATAFAAVLASSSSVFAAALPAKGDGYIAKKATAGEQEKTYSAILSKVEDPKEFYNPEKFAKNLPSCVSNVTISANAAFVHLGFNATPSCAEAVNSMTEVDILNEALEVRSYVQVGGSPWGLQRVSSANGASGSPQGQDFTYTFDTNGNLGQGVDIYIVDTGVRTTHAIFNQGGVSRATWGFSAVQGQTSDGDGHGTHVAGTTAGSKFGISQNANIIAVKVLGDNGSGAASDVAAGLSYVVDQHTAKKGQPGFKGSVINMSLGLQGRSPSLEEALSAVSKAGIHVSVAAGNDGTDACNSSPSALGGTNSDVVSVGAVNIDNQVSSFSNIGQCVDVYAPGEQVLSSWNTGDTIINFLSGTSMASPHVAGMMAYFIAQDTASFGQNPAALKAHITQKALSGQVGGNTGGGTSVLLNNGATGNTSRRLVKDRLVKDYVVPGQDFEVHSTDSPIRF